MIRMVQTETIIISACITIFSLGMLIVSSLSYKKYKNTKLLFISLLFVVLLIKGLLLSISLFYDLSLIEPILKGSYSGIFDLIILLLLFMATLKK